MEPKEIPFKEIPIDEQFRLVSNPDILYQKYDEESAIAVDPFLFVPDANCVLEREESNDTGKD